MLAAAAPTPAASAAPLDWDSAEGAACTLGVPAQKQYVEGQAFEYSEHITWPKVWRLLHTPSAMCCILQVRPRL